MICRLVRKTIYRKASKDNNVAAVRVFLIRK